MSKITSKLETEEDDEIPDVNEVLKKNKKKKKKKKKKKEGKHMMKCIPSSTADENCGDNPKYQVSNTCFSMYKDVTAKVGSVLEGKQDKAEKRLRKKCENVNNILIDRTQCREGCSTANRKSHGDTRDLVIIDDDDDKELNNLCTDKSETTITRSDEGTLVGDNCSKSLPKSRSLKKRESETRKGTVNFNNLNEECIENDNDSVLKKKTKYKRCGDMDCISYKSKVKSQQGMNESKHQNKIGGHSEISSVKAMISDEKELDEILNVNEILKKNKKKKKKKMKENKCEIECIIPNGAVKVLKDNGSKDKSMEFQKERKSKSRNVCSGNWNDKCLSNDKVSNTSTFSSNDVMSKVGSVLEVKQNKAKKRLKKKCENVNEIVISRSQNGEAWSTDDRKSHNDEKDIVIIDDNKDKELNDSSKDTSEPAVSGDNDERSKSKEGGTDWFSPLHYVWRHGKTLEALKNQGIIPITGKWRPEEIQKLNNNMKGFLASHEVNDFEGLVGAISREDRIFRKNSNFVLKMCKGIQRTAANIDSRIFRQFSNMRKGGFSEEETKQFFRLHEIYGRKWKKIGLIMNHNYSTFNQTVHRKGRNKGHWRPEEDEALMKIVHSSLDNGKTLKDINWREVSNFVGTRASNTCHRRWYSKSMYYSETNKQINFTTKDIYKLVSLIYESNVDDEYLIDWDNIANHFSSNVISRWLKWKFGVISKEVPHSHILEFEELIHKLHEIYHAKICAEEDATNDFCETDKSDFNSMDYEENPVLSGSVSGLVKPSCDTIIID